ncbi:hypothetical protein ABIC56_002773 [Acinetobacter bereziniae]|nr:hypothetical protein [Acinetobacter bereziniae]
MHKEHAYIKMQYVIYFNNTIILINLLVFYLKKKPIQYK